MYNLSPTKHLLTKHHGKLAHFKESTWENIMNCSKIISLWSTFNFFRSQSVSVGNKGGYNECCRKICGIKSAYAYVKRRCKSVAKVFRHVRACRRWVHLKCRTYKCSGKREGMLQHARLSVYMAYLGAHMYMLGYVNGLARYAERLSTNSFLLSTYVILVASGKSRSLSNSSILFFFSQFPFCCKPPTIACTITWYID